MVRTVDSVNQVDDDALLELFHDAVHRFKHVLQAAIAEDESGLAVMEARALRYIARHDGTTAAEIVKHSGRDKGQVARLIAELTAKKLVERTEGADRRSQVLRLSAQGKAVHRRLERRRTRAASDLFAPLSPAERTTMAALLGRMR